MLAEYERMLAEYEKLPKYILLDRWGNGKEMILAGVIYKAKGILNPEDYRVYFGEGEQDFFNLKYLKERGFKALKELDAHNKSDD